MYLVQYFRMAKPSVKCHPCRAAGMKQVNYFIAPERKAKLIQYCQVRGVSMTSLLNSLVARELEENRSIINRYNQRKRLHDRAKAYSRIRSHTQKLVIL